MAARAFCRGDEEAGLFAREAAYAVLQQMYTTVPPVTIKDRILATVGGNKVRPAPHILMYIYAELVLIQEHWYHTILCSSWPAAQSFHMWKSSLTHA